MRFTVDSYPDDTFEAVVQQIRQSATQSGNAVSYLVILDVDNTDGRLLTGMTANVDIITGRQTDVLRVPVASTRFLPRESDRDPASTLEENEDGSKQVFIWVPGEDPYRPARRAVEVGLEGEDYVEITGGLEPGDQVITRSRTRTPGAAEDDTAEAE